MEGQPKSPQELKISNAEWIDLAESLFISRQFANLLGMDSELGAYHAKRVAYLEEYFGLTSGAVSGDQE